MRSTSRTSNCLDSSGRSRLNSSVLSSTGEPGRWSMPGCSANDWPRIRARSCRQKGWDLWSRRLSLRARILIRPYVPRTAHRPCYRRLCRAHHRVRGRVVGAGVRRSVFAGIRRICSNCWFRCVSGQCRAIGLQVVPCTYGASSGSRRRAWPG